MLRLAGFRVQTAAHVDSALRILESADPPAVLVTDIVMLSGIPGVALAKMGRIRQPELRVVYVTGHDIPGVERQLLEPLLRKPVDDKALIEAINAVLFPPP